MNPHLVASPFVTALRNIGLVPETELINLLAQAADTNDLTQKLMRLGWLTDFHLNLLKHAVAGQTLLIDGRYRILKLVGRGGMGQVFLAEQVTFRKRVALKILTPQLSRDSVALARFLREARAVAAVNHPNIVQANDIGEYDGIHFLVMEWVDGMSLAQLVQSSGPLPLNQACEYARQTALGLAHAHAVGLVHRDIKPQNILVNREGVIKILDLGLAKFAEDYSDQLTCQHNSMDILGTADYMAPEQAEQSSEVTFAADLYSLGCTLYFMLVGQAPFAGKTTSHKFVAHMLHQLPRVPNVPVEFQGLLDRMTAKDPRQRHRSAQELVQELAYWASGVPRRMVATLPVARAVPMATLADAQLPTQIHPQMAPKPNPSAKLLTNVVEQPPPSTDTNPFAVITEEAEVSKQVKSSIQPRSSASKGLWLMTTVAAVVLVGASLGLWLILKNGGGTDSSADLQQVQVENTRQSKAALLGLSHEEFLKAIASFDGKKKTVAVMERLHDLNPSWESNYRDIYNEQGHLVRLYLNGHNLRSIQPLAAFSALQICDLSLLSNQSGSELTDISPLKGLRLKELLLNGHPKITDISPLLGMPLERLELERTSVKDLSVLKTIPTLLFLNLAGTPVKDVTILSELPLQELNLANIKGCDLTPLAKIKTLQYLNISDCDAVDLSFMKELPLQKLYLNNVRAQDLSVLRDIRSLSDIYMDELLLARHAEFLLTLGQLRTINELAPHLLLQFTVPENKNDFLFRDDYSQGKPTGWRSVDAGWQVVPAFEEKANVCLSTSQEHRRAIVGETTWQDYEIACWLNVRSGSPVLLARYNTTALIQTNAYALTFAPQGKSLKWELSLENRGPINNSQPLVSSEVPLPKSSWIRVRYRVQGPLLSAAFSEDGKNYQNLFVGFEHRKLARGMAGITHLGKEPAAFADFTVYRLR